MPNTQLDHIVSETITLVTGNLTQAVNLAVGSAGVEVSGNGNRWNFTPRLHYAAWDNVATPQDETANVTARGTGRFSEIDSFAAATDNYYFATSVPLRGMYVNILNANAAASIVTWEYWNGSAWTDLSDTDDTASGGATFAVDNSVTWTVPTDWAKGERVGMAATTGIAATGLYWCRFNVSLDLDSDTRIAEFIPLGVQTTGPVPQNITSGGPVPRYWFNPGQVGGIEAVGDNTETLVLNWLVPTINTTVTAE